MQQRLRDGLMLVALCLLILVLTYVILRELTFILRPLFVAVFLCYIIVPAHHWLVRRGLPSLLAYIVIVGITISSMYGLTQIAFRGVADLTATLPAQVEQLERIVDETMRKVERLLGIEPQGAETEPPAQTRPESRREMLPATQPFAESRSAAATDAAPAQELEREPDRATTQAAPERRWTLVSSARLAAWGRATVETFAGLFTGSLVVLFYLIFLLLEVAGFERRLVVAFGPERAARIRDVMAKVNVAVSSYLVVKTFISLLVGGLTAGILAAFGVSHALTWGLLTFMANYIPYIGSIVAVLCAVAASMVQFGDVGRPAAILVLLFAAQQATGSLLEPYMLGRRLRVSPLMILISLAFWGFLWGIPGMFLSAPLLMTLKIVLENIDTTQPVARLMDNS